VFLLLFIHILQESGYDVPKEVVFMQDNAVIHLSKKVKALVREEQLTMLFLPPYSPRLAPVELIFGVLKRKLKSQRRALKIDFGKKSGKEEIVNAAKATSKVTIRKVWSRLIREAKR
jgi:transposase